MLDLWTLDDAQAFRCTLAQVGCPRPVAEPLPPPDVHELARQLAPFALRQLARLAQGAGFPAVAAARELLRLAEGAKGPFPLEGDAGAPLPPWVDERQRLSFASNVLPSVVNSLGNANHYDSHPQSGDISHGESEGGAVHGSGGVGQISSIRETDSSQKPSPLLGDAQEPRKETFDDPFARAGTGARKYA